MFLFILQLIKRLCSTILSVSLTVYSSISGIAIFSAILIAHFVYVVVDPFDALMH